MLLKMPRILLVNPPSNSVEDDRIEPPLGLLYLYSTLLQNKFENVSLLDLTGSTSELELANKINSLPEADVYGISCFSTNYAYVKRIIQQVKERNPAAYVVLGGPHPTGMPDFTLQDSHANLVIKGEGEDAFAEAVNAFAQGKPSQMIVNGQGRKNIDSYAFPARSVVDISTYSRRLLGNSVIALLSSRGCRHRCIFCNSVVMGGGNRNVRYRSPENIIAEIKTIRDRFAYFRFNDDHFSGHPNLAELLLKLRAFDIKFRIFARVEDLDEVTCKLLKEAGCVHVTIGLESLNRDNLRIIGKARQAGFESNVKIAKAHGLIVRASFMVGLPFDNEKTVDESFTQATQLGLDEFAVYPLIPYPGTLIWKHPKKFGYTIVNTDFTEYVQMGRGGKACFALQHKNFTPADVENWLRAGTQLLIQAGVKHMSDSQIAQ